MEIKEREYTVKYVQNGKTNEISYKAKSEQDARNKFILKLAHKVSDINGASITLIYRKAEF